VGEGPGESEDVHGQPFVGPAGILLDEIIEESGMIQSGLRFAITNVIGCIPKSEEGVKLKDPKQWSHHLNECINKIQQLYSILDPRAVVCVGATASNRVIVDSSNKPMKSDKYLRLKGDKLTADIIHPSAILRAPELNKGLLTHQAVVTLKDLIDSLLSGEKPKAEPF
jgi:DNA polymerase